MRKAPFPNYPILMRINILAALLGVTTAANAATLVETRVEIARDPQRQAIVATDPSTGQEKKLAPLSSSEANSEFGDQVIITRQATWDPWKFDMDVYGFYTDNVALAPRRVDDFFMEYGVGASYSNRIRGGWTFESSLRQDFIRYDQYDSLDFDLTKFRTGVSYKAPWLWDATLLLRYQFEHLSEPGFGSQLLDSHSLTLGFIKSWKLGSGQRVFFGMLSEPNLAADPDIALRHEHAAFAGWSVRLTDHLTARLIGRAGYHTSPNTDRDDWHYVAAASATYALTDWASIGASTSLTWNRSSKDAYDYRNVLSGAYLGLELKF